MNHTFLLLGSNDGDRYFWINQGIELIEKQCGILVCKSSLYKTAAWGLENQPSFINLAVELKTNLTDSELLQQIHNIEQKLGRQRFVKWGQRTLDIDILFYNNEIIDTENLKIPHPFLHKRRFTLAPLFEIAPDFIHPVFRKTIAQLLAECEDDLEVKKLN